MSQDKTGKLVELEVPKAGDFGSLREVVHEEDFPRLMRAMEDVLWRSFAVDIQLDPYATTRPTALEVKRRFRICEEWILRARKELGYSLERTLDLMHHALRCQLNGTEFNAEKHATGGYSPT
jgi:hypothetical protein